MIDLYLLATISALILGLFAWGKINASIAKAERVKAAAATASAVSAKAAIDQLSRTAEDRESARQRAYVQQRTEQADIDVGTRNQFDTDGF